MLLVRLGFEVFYDDDGFFVFWVWYWFVVVVL